MKARFRLKLHGVSSELIWSYSRNVATTDDPRFDWRCVYACLLIWILAILSWIPLWVWEARHPPVPGSRDLGGGMVAAFCLCLSAIWIASGVMAILLGIGHYLWRKLRRNRRVIISAP
jgi:hypothetical protein